MSVAARKLCASVIRLSDAHSVPVVVRKETHSTQGVSERGREHGVRHDDGCRHRFEAAKIKGADCLHNSGL